MIKLSKTNPITPLILDMICWCLPTKLVLGLIRHETLRAKHLFVVRRFIRLFLLRHGRRRLFDSFRLLSSLGLDTSRVLLAAFPTELGRWFVWRLAIRAHFLIWVRGGLLLLLHLMDFVSLLGFFGRTSLPRITLSLQNVRARSPFPAQLSLRPVFQEQSEPSRPQLPERRK